MHADKNLIEPIPLQPGSVGLLGLLSEFQEMRHDGITPWCYCRCDENECNNSS